MYALVVDRLLASGTTTALYFATIHLSASKILADIAVERGQRAFVGKVCMDRNAPLVAVTDTASRPEDDYGMFLLVDAFG